MPKNNLPFFVGIAGIVFVAILYAPRYLGYSDSPKPSEAVILLMGPDYNSRKREALQLVSEGFANYLLVPAKGTMLKAIDERHQTSELGGKSAVTARKLEALKPTRIRQSPLPKHADLYENTHLEMLRGKEMMDVYGLKSGIFVSSPEHMRRIKIIADRMFAQQEFDLSFVPTRYEKPWGTLWWTKIDGLKQVASEYVKIGWFLVYSPFVGDSG